MLEDEKLEAEKIDLLKKHQEQLNHEYVVEFRNSNVNTTPDIL